MFTNKKDKRIYLDNSASTKVDKRILGEMLPYFTDFIGNPGSIHKEGIDAKNAVENARRSVASSIKCLPENVVFTSGGTESNNMAILGVYRKKLSLGKSPKDLHFITSKMEHNSVSDCFKFLEKEGAKVSYVSVDDVGRVDIGSFLNELNEKTVLISFLHVNNEIGTIENIKELVNTVKKKMKENGQSKTPLFHTDASQSPVWLGVDTQKLGVDMITLDSQKIYGPKGVGCLFVKDLSKLNPIMYGGRQEFGLRPGTPPVPLIVGFAKALKILEEERGSYVKDIVGIRDWFISEILSNVSGVALNGASVEKRIAGNINFSFDGIDGEQLVLEMDVNGIAISTKSACSTEGGGSRIVEELHKENVNVDGSVRFSLSRHTTKNDMEKVAKILIETVKWLRDRH
jgi:cysteine desulfurase